MLEGRHSANVRCVIITLNMSSLTHLAADLPAIAVAVALSLPLLRDPDDMVGRDIAGVCRSDQRQRRMLVEAPQCSVVYDVLASECPELF